ncbi:MAG TPA: MASE1 domain-containing protein [Opitutaceae bacterium]|nr:MASE1 domain-containing protein [Opitutaceae bacterium]
MPSPAAAHAAKTGSPPPEWSWSVRVALVGLAYFLLARVGLAFATITASISPVWPPSGLALAALVIGGVRLWPGVACGALAAAVSAGATPPAAVLMAMGNTLEAVVTVVLLRRLFDLRGNIEQPWQVVGYILLLGGVGAPISAVFGTAAAMLSGTIRWPQVPLAALTWAGGNFTGGLVIGPLLIAARQMVARSRSFGALSELLGLLAALALVGGTVFVWGRHWGITHPALLVLPFPLLVWIAWRFSIGGAGMAVLLLGTLAVWGTATNAGPFAGGSARAAFAYLLIYIVVIALTSLVLASFNAQRERLVARLRQREWQLSEAQRLANLGVWIWDLSRDGFQLSVGGLRILGLRQESFAPRLESFLGCVCAEDRPVLEELLRRVRLGEEGHACELRVQRADGQLRHVTTTCTILRDARGAPQVLLGTLFDFTERKRSEDERTAWHRKMLEAQKLESLGMLAGGIAHDFNNLLTGVLGNASLLRLQLPEGSPMGEGLRRIEISAERAADLCRQMLAYSGKGRFLVRAVELNEMARGTLALARNSVPKKAELVFQPGEALPRVRGDTLQLRQVLLNLLLNAAEALPEGGGQVVVRTGVMTVARDWLAAAYLTPELAPGEYAYVEVIDTGCGIQPTLREKIFEPFFSTKFTGRGLGLAAVAGIVRAHQGAVRVTSEPGRGATFRVVLPPLVEEAKPTAVAAPPPAPAAAPAASPTSAAVPLASTARPGGSSTWLVVDDEAAVRQVAVDVLGNAGLTVIAASDGVQALELFGADGQGTHAVLLDLSMPRLGGLETFKRLRERRADIPVVLMSGFEAEEALERFAGLGITGFLQKPFTIQALRAVVTDVSARFAQPR